MKKIKNPWMVSTIAVSLLSVVVIGLLSYQLWKTTSQIREFPADGQGFGQGQMQGGERPTGAGPGQPAEDTETSDSVSSENTNI